eukprot:GCRY01000762.1.p1 GENE.GCRY01000762.1~~GCRY01000762.1.p1  ORF type:complete len:400 (-),score=83.94 GCRY01000762.1:170-1369(-)
MVSSIPEISNFQFYCPVKFVFGKGSIAKIPSLLPEGTKKVCITYGGGSIKKNGVYDQVMEALKTTDVAVIEFGGIEPNPKYETLMKCVELMRKEKADFILAVGGGSVLDGSKLISAAVNYKASPNCWEIVETSCAHVTEAVPLADVMTLPATGSEGNSGGVISRIEGDLKLPFGSPLLFPKFSILDPTVTFSLPERQVYNGICDAFIHILEQYLSCKHRSSIHDRQAEALLLAFLDIVPQFQKDPNDYQVRADIMWACTQALNYHLSTGKDDWATHMIGHEMTAFFGLDHARTLVTVQPALWSHKVVREYKKPIICQFGRRVFGLKGEDSDELIDATVAKLKEFYHSCKMKTSWEGWGIDAKEGAEKVSARFAERGTVLGEFQKITPEIVKEILLSCTE